jgi:TonB family protein
MPLQTISAMKTAVILSAAMLLAVSGIFAQKGAAFPERQSLRVYQTVPPIFPRSMLEQGINNGDVRVVLDVDETGKLSEWLVVGYTHKDFADSVLVAVKRWQFEPMRLNGEPIPAQVELDFNFKSQGVVVSSVGPQTLMAGMFQWQSGGPAYWPRSLRDLDRIPIPLVATAPEYPGEFAERGVVGEATVEFYIDEGGAVRMPAVSDADFNELGALALQAVKTWRFEPATARGEPVLVKARQVFRFGPETTDSSVGEPQ